MGDWIKDVVDEIKAGAKEADILKKYNLGNDPTILRQIRGYNYLRTSDSEDAAKTAYPTIYNINQTRQTKQPTPVVPTAQEKQLANDMQGLKEMSKVNRGSDLKQMDKLQPIAEDIDLMSKKAAVDEMFAKNFAASNMGKTMKAVKERKAAEEETNQKVNTAISSARAEVDPMYNMYQKVVAPIFTTAQKATGNMASGLIRNLGNVAEAITGDEGISEAVGSQADNVKQWWLRNQSENASKRAGGAFLTEPMQQRGPIFNDGKVNTSAILPRTVETITNMAYLLGGAQVMGGGSAGLMASGYLNVYEDGRDEALASGLNTEQADAFGAINGTIQAALELISPNDIVFGKVKSKVTGEILKRIKSNMTRSEVIKEVAGAYGKEIGAENLQELMQMGAEKGLKWLYNETQLGEGQAQFQGTQITKDEILETIVLTTLATGAMASPNIMSETRPSKMKVGAYVTAAENMDAFTEMLQRKVEDGTLAEEEAPVLYGEVEKFARQYAQNKAAGYSEDQAARMAWNDRAKGKLDQIPQSVEGNPTLQSTLAQTVQSAKAELDSDTQDAKMGIPKQGEIVTGDKLAEIMGQIPDKGQPITESRALEYAGKNYVMGQVKLDDLYKSNKKFAKLVDQYQEAKNPTKPAEGQEKKPVDPEITNRIKTSNVNDLRMPAVIDGTDVIDGMHRLAQQYLNGTEYARAFTTIGDNAITDKTESDGKRQEEGQKDVLSTPSPETSVQPEVIAEKPPVADKPAPKPAVVENPARQPFKGKTHNVKYDSKGGRIVVAKNGKPINPESPEAKKVLDQHAKKYNYNIGETSDSKADTAPDFQGNENDMYTWSAENSNNPAELAAIYRSAPSQGNALSEKEQAIARRGISVKMDGYRRFGDMANMTQGKRLKYIRKDGVQIDTLAKEISDETGLDVTPADIINFMDTYPGGVGEALKEQESEAQTIARKKFEQITGIPFTNQVSDIAFKQFMGPEAVKAAEKKLDEDFDSIPDNDIIAAMWEAVDEAKASSAFDPAELEAFIASQTNDNEQTETGPTAEQDPGSEEAVTFDESQDEGPDNQEDLRAAPELNNAEDEVTLGDELDQFIADQATNRDIDSEIKSAKSRYDQAVARLNAAQAKLAKEQGQQSDIFGTGQQAGMFTPSAEDSKAVLDPLKAEVKEAKLEYEDLVQEKANIEDRKNPDMFDGAMAKMGDGILLAPNGKPSNLTPAQHAQVRTPEFKAWFGDWENSKKHSVVLDENGEPMVVYHGSGTVITEFKPEFTGQGNDQVGSGFYFTTNKETADGYTTRQLNGKEKLGGIDNPNVVDAFLSIKNPIAVEGSSLDSIDIDLRKDQVIKIIEKSPKIMHPEESPLGDWIPSYWETGPKKWMISKVAEEYTGGSLVSLENDFFKGESTEFRKAVHDATGFDGVVQFFENGDKHYVAWFPNQIKSASKNTGEFDKNNNSILAKTSNRLGSLFAKEFDTNDKALDNIAEGLAGDANALRAVEFIRPILAANPNVKVVPAREGEYSGRLQQALGLSYPDGTITLNFDAIPDEESMFRTLLHEYIHAATRYEIANNSAFKGELENVLADVRDALGVPDSETLISTMQSMGLIEDGKYGATNAYEMVAEVFSNPEFANYLKGIEYKGDNLLRRIYLAIIRLFDSAYKALTGAKESIDANNLADYLMSLTEAVVKPNQGTGGGTLASMKQKYPADIVRDFIRIKIGNGTDPTILRNMLVQKTGMTEQEADDFMVQALAEKTYDTPAAIRSNFVGPLQEGERARNAAVRMAPALEESIRGRMSDETKKYFQISNKQTEKEAEAFISMYDPDLVYSWLLDPETQKDLNKLPGRSKVYIYGAAIRALNAKAKAAKLNMNFSLGSEYADRARDLGAILFPMGTEAGQTVQAFRMLGDIAPDLVKPMVEKMMEEIEKRMRRNRKKKKPEAAPTPEAPAAPQATPVDPVSPEATAPDPGTLAPAPETVTPEEESPGIAPEVRQELLDMADEIEALPKGLPRNKKMMELTRRLAELDVANTSPVDIVQAIWYAHILSGIGTHAKNTFANLFNTFFEFFNLGIREVYKTRDLGVIPFMVKSWWDGLGKGMIEGTNILATGLTRDAVAKFGQSPLFEWFRWKDYLGEKYGKTGKVIGSILDYPANLITSPIALRYVGRALAAADAMMYTANAEMASGALAWEQVRLQNSDNPAAEIWKMTDEMLGNKRDKIEALQKQAESEGFTKGTREFRMRTNELLLETRAEDMNDMGDQYGAKVTFNHEPNGILAPWYRSVTQLTNAHRSVRFFMPFMRIVTNLMENYINYTPLGALKAYQGKREQPSKYFQKLTPDQRAELYIKSGIGLTVAMGAFLLGAGDDDDDGLIEISAAGTGDYQKNYELMKSGWREYSIRVGNKAISYKDSPLFAMLAAIGTASDHYKFGDGDPNNATVLEKFNVSAMGMVNAMFDQSWMSGLDELVTATKGVDKYGKTQNFGGKMTDAGINILRSLVVPNFVTQNVRVYNEAMDNPIKRAAGIEKIYRDLPYLNDNLNPIIDVWGEPVVPEQTLSWKPFRLEFDLDEDPLNDFLAKKKIWVGLPERKEVIDYNTGTALPMNDQQYYDYTKLSGQLSKQYLNELLTSGAFEDLSVVDIKRMIDAEKRKAREEAYYTLFTAE